MGRRNIPVSYTHLDVYKRQIIGLPANIFYGTSIPTCILVFKKCRKDSCGNVVSRVVMAFVNLIDNALDF